MKNRVSLKYFVSYCSCNVVVLQSGFWTVQGKASQEGIYMYYFHFFFFHADRHINNKERNKKLPRQEMERTKFF